MVVSSTNITYSMESHSESATKSSCYFDSSMFSNIDDIRDLMIRVVAKTKAKSTTWNPLNFKRNAILKEIDPNFMWSMKSLDNLTSIDIEHYLPARFELSINQYCPTEDKLHIVLYWPNISKESGIFKSYEVQVEEGQAFFIITEAEDLINNPLDQDLKVYVTKDLKFVNTENSLFVRTRPIPEVTSFEITKLTTCLK